MGVGCFLFLIRFLLVRNTEEAYEVRWEVKRMVMEELEGKWVKLAPFPEPPDDYSKYAEEVLRKN